MQAYMKSAMPYRGVPVPAQRKLYAEVFAAHPLASFAALRATALTLFREARFREERYAAIELLDARRYREHQIMAALPTYEELIVTGAWWDLVDAVATHRIGELYRRHPEEMRPVLLGWSRSDDMWLRRSAIICQVSSKKKTDLELLYACIEPSMAEKDFFLRKAIGWALRAYAWVDPAEVKRYVKLHEARLSGLSRREALKNCG